MCPKLDDARHRGFIFAALCQCCSQSSSKYTNGRWPRIGHILKQSLLRDLNALGAMQAPIILKELRRGGATFVASSESGKFKVYQVHQVHLLNNVNPGLSEQLTSIFWKLESGHRQSGFWLGGDGIPRSGMCVLLFCGEGGGEEWSGRHNLDNTLL